MSGAGDRGGRVVLVGAGPGDPDLVTLRGAAALRAADVLLYDELAPDELLALAPPGAERINVGKRGHAEPTRSQAEIEALMIERALAGSRVVRLKGGDPFVFGRGGEEATACAEARIPFEVVPGVSAALAAPAYAGIPVTDRRHAASFAVVTGHKDPTRVSEATRWAELGRAVDTLVILMGMKNLGEIVERVLEGGRDPTTPAAAIMDGTLGRQRVVTAPLRELPARVRAEGLVAPATVVIGSVASLGETLRWWERAPLFGLRVLVTRAREQAGELASALRVRGAEPVLVPMIRLEPPEDPSELDAALARLAAASSDAPAYDAIVLSSANALEFLVRRARIRGVDLEGSGARFFCAGPQTARAVLDAGLAVHLVPGGSGSGDAEAFLAEILRSFPPRGRRFLLPRSAIGREVLRDGLREAGARVDAVVAYQTLPPRPDEVDPKALSRQIERGEVPMLTFTSPSTVRNLMATIDAPARASLEAGLCAAVGPTTAKALRSAGIEPEVVADRSGAAALAAAIEQHLEASPARRAALRQRQASAGTLEKTAARAG